MYPKITKEYLAPFPLGGLDQYSAYQLCGYGEVLLLVKCLLGLPAMVELNDGSLRYPWPHLPLVMTSVLQLSLFNITYTITPYTVRTYLLPGKWTCHVHALYAACCMFAKQIVQLCQFC